MLQRALVALALLALAAGALPAASLDGATAVAGLARIEVFDGAGQLLCEDTTPVTVALAWGGPQDAPTGFYQSASSCASFAYPIDVAHDCVGAPGAYVRCEETGPPRWFELEPDGWFWYERDNLGFHFEVWGWLERSDA